MHTTPIYYEIAFVSQTFSKQFVFFYLLKNTNDLKQFFVYFVLKSILRTFIL